MAAVAERFVQYFTARCRHSGNLAFKAGRIVLATANSEEVVANVFDNPECRVRLRLEKGRLIAGCTCDHYDQTGTPCKHVWATLLAAEAEGALNGPTTPGELSLVWDSDWKNVAWDRQGINTIDAARDLTARSQRRRASAKEERGGWRESVQVVAQVTDRLAGPLPPSQRARYEIWYVFDIPATFKNEHLVLQVLERRLRPDGSWATPVPRSPARLLADGPQAPLDSWILQCLAGPQSDLVYVPDAFSDARSQFLLEPGLRDILVPCVAKTGRCFVRKGPDEPLEPLEWDESGPWVPDLELTRHPSQSGWVLRGSLVQGQRRMGLDEPLLLLSGGLVFHGSKVARLDDGLDFPWLALLRKHSELYIADEEVDEFVAAVYALPALPRLRWPEELRLTEQAIEPVPVVRIQSRAGKNAEGRSRAHALLAFDYGGVVVGALDRRPCVANLRSRTVSPRDWEFEHQVRTFLNNLGFRQGYAISSTRGPNETERFQISPRLVQRALRQLLSLGWHVELSGRRVRTRGKLHLEIRSSLDWFELRGEATFGDQKVAIPELLAAIRRGQETIVLSDGSRAYIPEEWRSTYGLLASVATTDGEVAKYHRSQVGLLDALLAAREEVRFDQGFAKLRERLRNFKGVRPASPPKSFKGKLRSYQREGLGWMKFLQEFGFGGCLADDMGLGKTVQVIALLEERRKKRSSTKPRRGGRKEDQDTVPPSLVVVPKSLVFNWRSEFARFAPSIRVLEHTGSNRGKDHSQFHHYDVVLTTYGTLRRDILIFKDFRFDYVILDEAQAIKNADSDTAKAVRLLQADHRLALTGTPIENHLGELWSLFEFLNPGMLGGARVFRERVGAGTTLDEEARRTLARALAPFILRRTKQQVAKDLPDRVEQTLICEMSPEQATLYHELREHYRRSLLGHIREHGLAGSTMHVLEALLRLRQAACHPGLIDEKYRDMDGGKLELLLEQLRALVEEGHKALVFSQFTTLLDIVRSRLDKCGIAYEYLDGRTRDRQQRVERFQTDPNCPVFLISLKAGGVGLNLTAAEYVILLDPWWNPAVEAQAIDRAHRIGQTKTVFAYRLIAKNTVEEKILQLQSWKKDLAESIITADNSLLKNLTAEDLELLLE